MKLVKSDWRSCLRPSILSDLLFIMLHAYDIPSYDPTDAINLWNLTGQRTRRSSQRPYGSRQDDGQMMTILTFFLHYNLFNLK